MNIIPRKAWGARYAAGFGAAAPATEIWLHHSVTRSPGPEATEAQDCASVRVLEDIGQQRFGGGISYTFAVAQSGRVFEGTGPLRRGAHTGGRNSIARAIVLIGDYSRERPTDAQLSAVAYLIRHGHAVGWWTVAKLAGGHRNAPGATTSCPGDGAWACIPVINSRVQQQAILDGDDDMTPEESARLARLERGLELVLQQLVGPGATIANPWPGEAKGGGWDTWRYGQPARRFTLVDYLRHIDRELNSVFDLRNRPAADVDTPVGHLLSVRAVQAQLDALVRALSPHAEH